MKPTSSTAFKYAGAPVKPDARIELATPDHPYVGRGGLKLAHGLRAALDKMNVKKT